MDFKPESFKHLLLKAGLSEQEVIVYLELLNQPSLTRWSLVRRTGFNKNVVYRAFERLEHLGIVGERDRQLKALSVNRLAEKLENSKRELDQTINELKNFGNLIDFDWQKGDEIKFLRDQQQILDAYMYMSEVPYGTCLDFGDLENYVPVLGGMDPVFKFRENRFNQKAKNWAICTTYGPYTQCMLRKSDMKRFKSNIDRVKVKMTGKWMIFSDTNEYVMYNDFRDEKNPTAVLIKSKVVSDCQRMQFEQFAKNLERI